MTLLQVADLVLLLVDASFGFEMEIFEFLNICQVPYTVFNIICSLLLFFRRGLTHMKSFNVVIGNRTEFGSRGDFTFRQQTWKDYVLFLVCLVPSPYADRHHQIDKIIYSIYILLK